MILWVMYDIVNDKARTKVAKLCKQAGLYRVQYSVFLGKIEHNRMDGLQLAIKEQIDEQTDKVYMFPMSKKELKQTVQMGQAFDKKLINDQINALFF